jgi:hypothetical protein
LRATLFSTELDRTEIIDTILNYSTYLRCLRLVV